MKTFTEQFIDARNNGTPLVGLRTFDAQSAMQAVSAALDTVAEQKSKAGEQGTTAHDTPITSWDSIHGLRGMTDPVGVTAVGQMCAAADGGAGVERGATVDLAIALGVLEEAEEDVITFVHNPHLVWDEDKKVIQGIVNLRDRYKARGNMLVLLFDPGVQVPAELQQDTLFLEQPLPTRAELRKIILDTFKYAAQNKKYAACKKPPTEEVIKAGEDALIGLPKFPADQASAVSLNKLEGILDVTALWTRKKDIISQCPGLTYHTGNETLADMYGCNSIREFGVSYLEGPKAPTLLLRMDEIEKQFMGAGTDSSGTKGNLLGEWLSWVNDRKIVCSLFVGVPGSSKSWSAFCLGGQYKRPVIEYSIPGMEHELVGASQRNMRNAHKRLDAISDEKIWLIATANRINALPAELISRFQVGGIWFFDAPDTEECNGIMRLNIKRYGLDPNQELPDMTNWTGRDVDNCALKADLLGKSLMDVSKYIIPMMTSHSAQMEDIRQSANNRFLSASKSGLYQYTKPAEWSYKAPVAKIVEGRKMR